MRGVTSGELLLLVILAVILVASGHVWCRVGIERGRAGPCQRWEIEMAHSHIFISDSLPSEVVRDLELKR